MKYWLENQNTLLACDSSPNPKDLVASQPATQANLNLAPAGGSFAEILSADIRVDGDAVPGVLSVDTALDIPLIVSSSVRYRLRALSYPGCSVLASSGYSSTISAPAVPHTQNLSLTWPKGANLLRFSVEASTTGGGSVRFRTGVNTYASIPWLTRVEAILLEMETRMGAMTLAKGYAFDYPPVVTKRVSVDDLRRFPAIVRWGHDILNRVQRGSDTGYSSKEATLEANYQVRTQKSVNAPADLLKVQADMARALEGDPRALGLRTDAGVVTINVGVLQENTGEEEIQKPNGFASSIVEVRYRMGRGRL